MSILSQIVTETPADIEIEHMLGSHPAAVVDAAQRRATEAWTAGCLIAPWMKPLFMEWWSETRLQTQAVQPTRYVTDHLRRLVVPADELHRLSVARLRIALQAGEAFKALLSLDSAQHYRLQNTPQGETRNAVVREIIQSTPGGSAIVARRDARAVALEEANRQRQAVDHAAFIAAQPGAILAELEASGAALSLDKAGTSILTTNSGAIGAAQRAHLVEHKAGVVALLARRAAAATPTVVA